MLPVIPMHLKMDLMAPGSSSIGKPPSFAEQRAMAKEQGELMQNLSLNAAIFGGLDAQTFQNASAKAENTLSPTQVTRLGGGNLRTQKAQAEAVFQQAVAQGDQETALTAQLVADKVQDSIQAMASKARGFAKNAIQPLAEQNKRATKPVSYDLGLNDVAEE